MKVPHSGISLHLEYQKIDSHDLSAGQLAAGAAGHLQLLIELLDTISDRIFLINDLGKITFVNKAFLNAYGLSSDEVLSKSAEKVLPAEIASACEKIDPSVFQRGESARLETDWKDCKSGVHHWLEIHKFPMRDVTGKITGIVGISRDITARRQAEEELKRSESMLLHASRLSSLGEMAAGITHEVNQPLFSILNYAKAIENKLQDCESLDLEALREWIGKIKREATRGGEITHRLKSFVKPAEQQRKSSVTNHIATSAINQTILDTLDFMAIEARDADIAIETKLAENLPDLAVDRIQIQQVLVNLLKNAIEACTSHSTKNPRVAITTQQTTAAIEVTVADNGPGISTADNVNILDPFQTTKHEGIGLGLAISNTIIDDHQGHLTYRSNDWGGATFSFTLPMSTS